jgi:hypothetical protein
MRYRNYYCTPKYSEGDKTYYGNVNGVPDIPIIEAENLDDFERLFHQAVDDYLDHRRKARSKTRWGMIISLLVIISILVVLVLTCPKKDQHVEALMENITYVLGDAAGEDDLKLLGSVIGSAIAKPVVNSFLVVDDMVIFSIGHIEYDGQDNIVSVGVLGHVFTASKEQIKSQLEQNKDLQEFLK